MPDKRLELSDAVAFIKPGMTIGIGGWGSRRKPMAFVRELLRTDVKDLTVVSLGGPDVGLLVAAGKVKKLIYGFVTLDSIPLDPLFTAARERGELELQIQSAHARHANVKDEAAGPVQDISLEQLPRRLEANRLQTR